METQTSNLSFKGQHFYVGIDVHKKQWTTTIRSVNKELKTFSMNPAAKELAQYMQRHYPEGHYHSAYEAGFSGFHIHESLTSLGFKNQVIHPADIPTMDKEKRNKDDVRDSRKIARELENRSLKGIYVPNRFHQEFRSLCRLRERSVSHQTRLKNRITSYFAFYGITIPSREELPHWSKRFIGWLANQALQYSCGNQTLALMIDELTYQRTLLLKILRQIRKEVRKSPEVLDIIRLLETVPGVGFIAALTFYSEIMDMTRFGSLDHLKSFVGLAPESESSDETTFEHGLTNRHNRHLRYVLVEAAWVAIRKDPALLNTYQGLTRRMKPQKAIIRITVKLLSRIRHVWITKEPYCLSVVK